jgi:FkbM family methyltransferase
MIELRSMLSLRWMRKNLARWVPERVKAPYRARLFGYGDPSATASPATVRMDAGTVTVAFEGIELRAPVAAADDVRYHFVENAASVEEIRGLIGVARKTGGVLVDVGAMRGLFSAAWILARPGNRAVAYEPSPTVLGDLEAVRELNALGDRLSVSRAALGRARATVTAGTDAMGLIDFQPLPGAETFATEVTTLDEEVASRGFRPDAVKIDVEGNELDVLLGASTLLAARPVVFMELHLDLLERRGVRPGAVVELLSGCGYRFFTCRGGRLRARAVTGSPSAVLRFVAR